MSSWSDMSLDFNTDTATISLEIGEMEKSLQQPTCKILSQVKGWTDT